MTIDTQKTWDAEAATFDDEPDHGLRDPQVRAAWRSLLVPLLPPEPARILDLGCGTGSLSVLLAEQGHQVTGLDLSPRMLDRAAEKAHRHGVPVTFLQGDAAQPRGVGDAFDVVIERHVLWAMPDPSVALTCWRRLVAPSGRLVLIEGQWATGAGLAAHQVTELTTAAGFVDVRHQPLPDEQLWGRPIEDDRFLVIATAPEAG